MMQPKPLRPILFALVFSLLSCLRAGASEADDTTITITGETPGPTAFIKQLSLKASDTEVLQSIRFTIKPKAGSVTRPLSGSYSHDYLASRGDLVAASGVIYLPVYGLYSQFTNAVTLTYNFNDGSSSQAMTTLTTGDFSDSCDHAHPTKIKPRTANKSLSYDYIFVRGACSVSPVIIDTDGEVRWVSPFASNLIIGSSSTFYNNAVYVTRDSSLYRVDLDGTVTPLADYSSLGVLQFHHNIDPGKYGMILDADTQNYTECANLEVDTSGNVLKTWNLAHIISAAMRAGGDDPSQFVYPQPTDWFHNNAVAYRRADNSLIVSSRENFLIGLDYPTLAIKWILGDETKKWFEFPSLAKYALTLTGRSLAPIGQHAVSVTLDNNVFLMDNGENSLFQDPPGNRRTISSPRKYVIDQEQGKATELDDYPGTESIFTEFCGSAYEDAKSNYLVDYAFVNTSNGMIAEILGYEASGKKAFDYRYTTGGCGTAYNSLPLHLESTGFPSVRGQVLNLSARATVENGDSSLIGGFVVTGKKAKTVILRAIGPSLAGAGIGGALPDPVLRVYDSSGTLIRMNDNWQADQNAAAISGARLAPSNPLESATLISLAPGSYTVVVSGQNSTMGVSLVEVYDLSPSSGRFSRMSALGGWSKRVRMFSSPASSLATPAVRQPSSARWDLPSLQGAWPNPWPTRLSPFTMGTVPRSR